MHRILSLALLALAGAPAAGQAPRPPAVSVTMVNFRFAPNPVAMRAGAPIVLHLVNNAGGGHNFTAPEFFAAASLAPESRSLVRDGRVEVPRHSAVDVALTPAAGQYRLRCTHTLHSAFGMKGAIVVR